MQVNGKVRSRITVATGADEAEHDRIAREDPKIAEQLAGKTVRKAVIVPGHLVNFVVS